MIIHAHIIQQVHIDDEQELYLVGIDPDTDELCFRVSTTPSYLQKEKIKISKGFVYTNLHFFAIGYYQKFLMENGFIKQEDGLRT